MTAQLTTTYRIESDGKVFEWTRTEPIQIARIIVNRKRADIDFRYVSSGKGDSRCGMMDITPVTQIAK